MRHRRQVRRRRSRSCSPRASSRCSTRSPRRSCPRRARPAQKPPRVGPFIASMVAEAYDAREQRIFLDGVLRGRSRHAVEMHGVPFMAATAAQRIAVLEQLDREQLEYMRRLGRGAQSRRARAPFSNDERACAARLLHVGDRLHAGDALRRNAGPLRALRPVCAGREIVGAACIERDSPRFRGLPRARQLRRTRPRRRSSGSRSSTAATSTDGPSRFAATRSVRTTANTFRVVDGLLTVAYDEYADFDGAVRPHLLRRAVFALSPAHRVPIRR